MKTLVYCLTATFLLLAITACGKIEPSNSNPSIPSYQLTAREMSVLNAMFDDEVSAFSEGGNSLLGINLQHETSKQIAIDYSKNEVGADAKYKNKTIFISATITAIQSGINDQPFLTLNGANIFQTPQARFAKNDIQRISALEKGQKIFIICNVQGEIVGTPMLNDCVFADEYANDKKQQMINKYNSALAGNKENIEKIDSQIFLFSIYTARQLSDSSQCGTDNLAKCKEEIASAINKSKPEDQAKQDLLLLSNEFSKYGFILPADKK